MEAFPLKISNKTKMANLTTFNTVLEVLDRAIRQETAIKDIQNRKKERKLSLFAYGMIYTENPQGPTKTTVLSNQ